LQLEGERSLAGTANSTFSKVVYTAAAYQISESSIGELAMPTSKRWISSIGSGMLAICVAVDVSSKSAARAQTPKGAPAGYDDHQHMMEQLSITKLRPGRNGQKQVGDGFDEATANVYKDTMPDVLTMHDGTKVTTADAWPKRRSEILEDFEREVYGRIPANVPKVTWEVIGTSEGKAGDIATVTKQLAGHVDNSADPDINVVIQASFTVPAGATEPVPLLIEFGGFGGGARRGAPATPRVRPALQEAINHGWGIASITPTSVQPDSNQLRSGIIGLTNKGQPRKPDDWGALRAWQWGVSRMIDYFEANPESKVDPQKIGIEGVSRYGKAAIVTEAFEPRIAVAFVASSGEGGVKLHRHNFGEAVENLTGGEYYWMAGNFLKYGAEEPVRKTAADLPVDSHELIALCAPRPCFISYGIPNPRIPGSIPDPAWVDAHGSFMAGVLAGPVYRLLGKQDFGTAGDYLTDEMPPVGKLIGGELAWRQHEGGHTADPNFPAFFDWVGQYIKAPSLPAQKTDASTK
jgi:hypothetical protein